LLISTYSFALFSGGFCTPTFILRLQTKSHFLQAMGRVIWSMWGRLQAIASAMALLVGGIIGLFYRNAYVGGFSVGLSILLFALELPLSFLPKTLGVSSVFFGNSHLPRAFFYLAATPLLFFQAPTISGGLCLALTSLTYVMAVVNRESYLHPNDWMPGTTNSTKSKGEKTDAGRSNGACNLCLTSGGNLNCQACRNQGSNPEKLKSQTLSSPRSLSSFDNFAASAPRTLEGQANRFASSEMEAGRYGGAVEDNFIFSQDDQIAEPAAVATDTLFTRARNPTVAGGFRRSNNKRVSTHVYPRH
jgi:hypothetical protein